jgi:hypothetical protein
LRLPLKSSYFSWRLAQYHLTRIKIWSSRETNTIIPPISTIWKSKLQLLRTNLKDAEIQLRELLLVSKAAADHQRAQNIGNQNGMSIT